MNYCDKLFNIIDEKNLKQADLAKKLNVQKSVVSAWKKRKTNPPLEYLVQICEFLGVKVTEFLEINEDNLTNNEREMLNNFNKLSEREQIKWIGKLEEVVVENVKQELSATRTG